MLTNKLIDNIVVFSDLHIHNYKRFSKNNGIDRLESCLKILSVIYKQAYERQANLILFAGDLFDSAGLLPTVVVNETLKTFRKLHEQFPEITFVALSGNHDHATKNTTEKEAITALNYIADAIDNFLIIDNKKIDFGNLSVVGIPYYEDKNDFQSQLKKVAKDVNKKQPTYLLTHQTPNDVLGNLVEGEFDPNDLIFNKFEMTFNGHIHRKILHNPKVVTLGNPMHKDRDDIGQYKGYYLLNTKDGKVTQKVFYSLHAYYPNIFIYEGLPNEMSEHDKLLYENSYVIFEPKIDDVSKTETLVDVTDSKEEILKKYWKEKGQTDNSLLINGLTNLP